jgi:hypothetical protein
LANVTGFGRREVGKSQWINVGVDDGIKGTQNPFA